MKHESLSQVVANQIRRTARDDEYIFNGIRRRLERIARRMLGSVAEAEDVVQDTWLRWHAASEQEIENGEAWLVSVTTRLAVDRLRVIKTQREHCSTLWLPELQMTEHPATPQEMNERADDVSMAYLVLLERLTPEARAAFLMHEVFDFDYDQIAQTLDKTQDACRQLVSRARVQLRSERSNYFVPQEIHHHLLKIFVQVLKWAGAAEIRAFLAEDALLTGTGCEQMTYFSTQDEQSRAFLLSYVMSWPSTTFNFCQSDDDWNPLGSIAT